MVADLDARSALSVSAGTSDTVKAQVDKWMKSAFHAISRAQCVNLCFVVDTTGSMAAHMNAAKEEVGNLVVGVKAMGCRVDGLAFVSYKDWDYGEERIQVHPFSPDEAAFAAFVAGLRSGDGGIDVAEDVLGGLQAALNLPWPTDGCCNVVFHIGDAPPHGKQFKSPSHAYSDNYPDGHSLDPTPAALFRGFNAKNILYFFGKITPYTDRMVRVCERRARCRALTQQPNQWQPRYAGFPCVGAPMHWLNPVFAGVYLPARPAGVQRGKHSGW